MTRLKMPTALYEAIRTHGEETYPHECCGVLIGTPTPQGWQVLRAPRAANTRIDSAHNRYNIAPLELVRFEREARSQGLEIAGFYHSHPDHPAQWSVIDFAEAHWLGCFYMITEVAQGKACVSNVFLLTGRAEEEKQFVHGTILLED